MCVNESRQVWDYKTCKLNKTLAYQNSDTFMMHKERVLCIAFSRNNELMASGSQDGVIKVWDGRGAQ